MEETAGFSMTEVLVSMFVLSLGVIGAAGMQLTAVRATQQSRYQSNALQIAAEMADKMRANASQMKQPDSENPFLKVDYDARNGAAADASSLCYASSCDSAQLAAFDIDDLQKRIKAMLPSGRVVICRDLQPWDDTAHAFRWACDQAAAGSIYIKVGWQARTSDNGKAEALDSQIVPTVVLPVLPYVQ